VFVSVEKKNYYYLKKRVAWVGLYLGCLPTEAVTAALMLLSALQREEMVRQMQ